MTNRRYANRAIALSMLAAGLGLAQGALAFTCEVPGVGYPTIQSALDDADCEIIGVANGTYTENLTIARGVVLTGSSRSRTIIDGGGLAPVIRVEGGNVAFIDNLTATNGFNDVDGGGVDVGSQGVAVLNNVRLTGNVARAGGGAYAGSATLYVTDSLVDNNVGGGLSVPVGSGANLLVVRNTAVINNTDSSPAAVFADNLSMLDSIVSGNQGDDGVLFFEGVVERSEVSNNLIDSGLCAVRSFRDGTIRFSTVAHNVARITGGVCNGGRLTIANSTITNNTGLQEGGGLGQTVPGAEIVTSVQFSTIADNEGPLGDAITVAVGRIVLQGSIVAGTTPGEVCRSIGGSGIVSLGDNVGTDDSCSLMQGDLENVGDAGLAALGDNGGPTPTRALLADSPALDSVVGDTCPARDQRGVVRPQGEACDAGAYEAD